MNELNKKFRLNRIFLLPLFALSSIYALAQFDDDNHNNYQIRISKTSETIVLDGHLNEAIWRKADLADSFWMVFPNDIEKAKLQTEVRLTYNDRFLYISAICYSNKNHIIQTRKRDIDFWSGDGFAIVLDPINQRTNGFLFGVNPFGIQMEGLITGDIGKRGESVRGLNYNWDNKWFSEIKQHEDHWTVEIAIPFNILRYSTDKYTWGINFLRRDAKRNTYHAWASVPVQFHAFDLGYTGTLNWDFPPAKTKRNIAVIPYTAGAITQGNEESKIINKEYKLTGNIGIDVKIAITSALNLDLTFNPDFSQVEVDQQVTNLSRFSIQFPERRTFFLENSDIFADFGSKNIRPFFSRKIGLDENGNPIPILYGIRLSGNVSKNTRIGLMNIHTERNGNSFGQNHSAFAIRQKVFSRSIIKGFLFNRQAMDEIEIQKKDYGRNAGLEFFYQSKDGNRSAWVGYSHSFKKEITSKNFAFTGGLSFGNRNWSGSLSYEHLTDNYFADIGFLQRIEEFDQIDPITGTSFSVRQGNQTLLTHLAYTFYSIKSNYINAHYLELKNFQAFTPTGHPYEGRTNIEYEIRIKDGSEWELEIVNNRVKLFEPFELPSLTTPLPIDKYNYSTLELEYESNTQHKISYAARIIYGAFYNGKRHAFEGAFNYRLQPIGNFGLQINYNKIRFLESNGQTHFFLINPKIEISFSKNLFWTTFLQYNTQKDNFNLNSRFQWRFNPMSDLYIVYSDNYKIAPFVPNNRTLVLKINYWFNL